MDEIPRSDCNIREGTLLEWSCSIYCLPNGVRVANWFNENKRLEKAMNELPIPSKELMAGQADHNINVSLY